MLFDTDDGGGDDDESRFGVSIARKVSTVRPPGTVPYHYYYWYYYCYYNYYYYYYYYYYYSLFLWFAYVLLFLRFALGAGLPLGHIYGAVRKSDG